ncbi:MAG TPA: imidazolonepropionase [Candidatus Binatia bacterium]|nr:imidazolonepropionase [Candidatus Binatia bacterium]
MALLLTHATQLLTLRGNGNNLPRRGARMRELGIVTDGAVLVDEAKIVAVGASDEVAKHDLARRQRGRLEEIDCRGKVVLPGFVDSHTHPVFTAPRLVDFEKRIAGATYEEIAQAGGGIRASLLGVREASKQELVVHVLRALREMSAQGTTAVEAKSGYGLSFDAEIKSLEAIREASRQWKGTAVATLLGAHVVPPEYRDQPDEYVRVVCEEMIPAAARGKLADFVDVFCERGAFTPEQSQRILRNAMEHRLGLRAHVCQLTPTDLGPLLQLHPASLDHMDFVSDGDVSALAATDTIATLLPAANYFLGPGAFPPARKLIDAGVAVALATDYNPGTAPTPSMPFVLSVACTHMKMSPAEAITAATYNGACALRLQERKGSLEPGKDADIAIFEASDYRELAYWFGVNRCRQTILGGVPQLVVSQ